jgi:trehalose 6-phosphate phosphatase
MSNGQALILDDQHREGTHPATVAAEARLADWALFLDIDGTLIRRVPDPRDAVIDDELRELLASAIARLGGAVALVSGRSLKAIRNMLGPYATYAAGLYGLEVQWDGIEAADRPKEPGALRDLAHKVARLFADEPGLVIERKGAVLSLNTGRRSDLLAVIQPMAEAALAGLPAGYRIVVGHAGVELMPAEADKGAAIRRFMTAPPFQGRRPIFIGDDQPDEHGFAAVNAVGGVSVRVLPAAETGADFGIEDVQAVRAWLGDDRFPDLGVLRRLGA